MKWQRSFSLYGYVVYKSGSWVIIGNVSIPIYFVGVSDWVYVCTDTWRPDGWCIERLPLEGFPRLWQAKQYVEILIENNPQAWEEE